MYATFLNLTYMYGLSLNFSNRHTCIRSFNYILITVKKISNRLKGCILTFNVALTKSELLRIMSENRTSIPRLHQKSHDPSVRGSKRSLNCSTVVPCSCQTWKLPAKQWRLPACTLLLLCMVERGALVSFFFFFLRTLPLSFGSLSSPFRTMPSFYLSH